MQTHRHSSRSCVADFRYLRALLSKLAGVEARGRGKSWHFERSVGVHGLRLAILLSKLVAQESGICCAAASSGGGGWKG